MFAIVEKDTKKCHAIIDNNFVEFFKQFGVLDIIEIQTSIGIGQISTDKGYIHTINMTKINNPKMEDDAIMIRSYPDDMTLTEAEKIVYNQ